MLKRRWRIGKMSIEKWVRSKVVGAKTKIWNIWSFYHTIYQSSNVRKRECLDFINLYQSSLQREHLNNADLIIENFYKDLKFPKI